MKDFADIDNASGSFPDVVAVPASGAGETDGTAFTYTYLTDQFGWIQALLSDQGVTPNDVAESASASQILDSIKSLINDYRKYSRDDISLQNLTDKTPDGAGTNDFNAVAFRDATIDSNPLLLIVGQNGDIQTSNDFDDFTQQTPAGAYSDDFYCAAWIDYLSKWIIGGDSGEIETASAAASSWTQQTPGSSYTGTFDGIATNGSIVVIVGTVGEIQSSNDGITFTRRNNGGSDFQGVLWDGSQFVAIQADGTIWTSSDGVTWVQGSDIGTATIFDIIYDSDDGVYFACGYIVASQNKIYRSTNLTTWTEENIPSYSGVAILKLTKMNRRIFSVMDNNRIYVKDMSNTWELIGRYESSADYKSAGIHPRLLIPVLVGDNGLIRVGLFQQDI